ncbi:MAG: methyl-accepting chemotaxis protein [Myxococcota bacterium]
MSAGLPSGKAFHGRLLAAQCLFSFPALAVVIGCLLALLEMTREQWVWLFGAIAVWTLMITAPQMALDRYRLRDLMAYLDLRSTGAEVSRSLLRAAYRNASRLPRGAAIMGFMSWLVPVVAIGLAMELRWPQWGGYEHMVLLMAGTQAGIVAAVFLQFAAKRAAQGVRAALVADVPDPEERAELTTANTVREKLLWCVTLIAIVPVVFAALLFHARALRSVEEFAVGLQGDVLEQVLAGGDPQQARRSLAAALPSLAEDLWIASLEPEGGAAGGLAPEMLAEVKRALAAGADRGDSIGLPSDRHFSWRRAPDGSLWVVSLPADALAAANAQPWLIFLGLLLGAGSVACGLAYLLAEDVSQATVRLCASAERLASGDLRPGEVFESEDELGEVSRAFDRMAGSLRVTIGSVAQAADRVEATAGSMSEVSSSVFSVTADQVAGIQHTSRSMETISAQVRGIADSAQQLNGSVEEASSSILELGASGEELNETAGVMSTRANEVSASIEQMVRSVKQVLENTETLSEAAVETSSSMGEMATSMREVDASAEETARLSREVVKSAEQGQAKMVQTIQGMDAIREATETAEGVIRSLGGRATEIGAIVDVIDDVADETSLLALNAAIIAAQAGEHGKAFSVVADEIKDLAERVLASTKEIGSQIRSVQEESARATGAIERGSRSVADGVDLTAEAGSSLEAITQASRESGERISRILTAVREQARAASHVASLMERVRGGVEEIRSAAAEQDRGNEVVHRGSVAMRDVATQVRGTTEEQARGSGRIRESVEGVRDAAEQIHAALQEQSASCRSAAEFLDVMHARTQSNEQSAARLEEVVRELAEQAENLRENVGRFRVS